MTDVGETPYGRRRIATVTGGSFEGEELKGTVLPAPGGDWLLLRRDGILMLNVRLTLKTDDGHLVYMSYEGMRHGPAWVIEQLNKGEKVDPEPVLLPHHAVVRDGVGEVPVPQPHRLRRHRPARSDRAGLRGLPDPVKDDDRWRRFPRAAARRPT